MALSEKQRKALEQACPQKRKENDDKTDGAVIADIIDSLLEQVADLEARVLDLETP